MQVEEENQEQFEGGALPSLNDMISPNTELNPNQVTYQSSTTNKPAGQTKLSYITTTKTYGEGEMDEENENENLQQKIEIQEEKNEEISEENQENGEENKKYKKTTKIEEEPDSTTKIVERVIQSEKPSSETNYYEKRVVKTTTTTTTTRGGNTSTTQTINSRYSNTNTNANNIVRNNPNRIGSTTTGTYTRPIASSRGGGEKNIYIRNNNNSGRTPSNNRVESNNRYGVQNSPYSNNTSQNMSNRNRQNQNQKKIISSQSYVNNKYQLKKPETSNYNRQVRSPEQNEVKKKTINRGGPVKNIQITHIICSSKPRDFHIIENLDTESLQTDPIEISKADRAKLKQSGKSSWTTSVQDNVKPIVTNLKGKTTVFQHARGIGMTNEKKENINPMFYSSEIKKLEPIVKEKEKEKVEYMTFRNEGAGNINKAYNNSNTSRTNYNNYNRGNNSSSSQQKKTYTSNTNKNYNSNTVNVNTRGSRANTSRRNQVYTRGNYSTSGNNGENIKETRAKVQMGSRSQYRTAGNPTSSVITEKRVYN